MADDRGELVWEEYRDARAELRQALDAPAATLPELVGMVLRRLAEAPVTDTPNLRDQIAHAICDRQRPPSFWTRETCPSREDHRLDADAVLAVVAPLLAADRADLRIRRNALADALGLPHTDDERGGDFHALVQRVADRAAIARAAYADRDEAWRENARLRAKRDDAERERDDARAECARLNGELGARGGDILALSQQNAALRALPFGPLPYAADVDEVVRRGVLGPRAGELNQPTTSPPRREEP